MSRTTTKIIVRRENGEVVSQYALGVGEHLIGRESGSGIFIEDDHVSRQHAKLIISADAIEIEDLDSTSGTFLDGMAVRGRIPVEPGQRVHISDLYLDIEQAGFRELIKGARLSEGRFTLIEKLGQGGMGAVWKALDEESGAHVALKLLPPEMSSDPSGLRDLEREVEKTKYLNHPNIVQIGGLWHAEDDPAFLTLEYVEGNNLEELRPTTSHKLLPWASVQHYMLQLCDALEYAHSQRIAHRDIKPSNLLVNRSGELKLADFGIAASIAGTTGNFTTDVLSAGTPSYMAPQQIEGRRPQSSDDIYALGATFYDLLTGTPPFYQGEVIHQVLNVPPTPMEERLRELGTSNDIPDYVGAMVMACLQKDPEKRPVSAAAIRDWIKSKGKKVDLAKGERMVWSEPTEEATTRNPPPMSGAGHPGASIVKGEGVSKETRSKALAYGIAAAILSIIIGTAVILHESGSRSDEQKEDEQGRPVISAKMQAQLKEGLVAYYPFNGNANDESGNGHDGTVKGATPAPDKNGKGNSAYNFDGKSWIELPQSEKLKFGAKDFTYCAWFNTSMKKPVPGGPTIGGTATIVAEDNNRIPQRTVGLSWTNNLATAMFTIVTGKGEGLHLRALGLNVTDSRWHQLVGVRSGSTFKLAIDGKILSTSENPNITQTDIGVPVRIGARVGSFINPFAGSIDDVRIYNRALSAGEVKALYDLEKPISKTTDLSSPPVPGAVKWNGHWYAVLTEPCPYEAAREKCKELGGHLAYVETQEENSFILGLAEKAGLSAHGVWLGGADEKNEGDWLWLNGKPIINTFWAGGQPGPGNYLVMFCGKSAQSIKGEWGVDISKGLSPVVCEWE